MIDNIYVYTNTNLEKNLNNVLANKSFSNMTFCGTTLIDKTELTSGALFSNEDTSRDKTNKNI